MEFATEELTRQVGQTARDFANQYIKPFVMEWDESQHFPKEVFEGLGRLGLMGVVVPEEYGGSGLSYIEYVTVIQEIAKVCGSIGLSLAAHNSLCTGHILAFGNEAQKKKFLPVSRPARPSAPGASPKPIPAATPEICAAPPSKKATNGSSTAPKTGLRTASAAISP
ncbi:acyl-CoA dehydrogenase family protein [Puia sp. P3]|uniref:acyl-CoA dehydrogenase family protein n=1 Tax=Puia sp. P3 TaxID=3423952 RepID=UPI003D6651FC